MEEDTVKSRTSPRTLLPLLTIPTSKPLKIPLTGPRTSTPLEPRSLPQPPGHLPLARPPPEPPPTTQDERTTGTPGGRHASEAILFNQLTLTSWHLSYDTGKRGLYRHPFARPTYSLTPLDLAKAHQESGHTDKPIGLYGPTSPLRLLPTNLEELLWTQRHS